MSLIDQVASFAGGLLGAGVRPSERRGGLRDPIAPGAPGADRFGPGFSISVNGMALPEPLLKRIVSVEYEDNEDLFDQLTIRIEGFIDVDNNEGAMGALAPQALQTMPIPNYIQGQPWFSEGNIIAVYMGYASNYECIGAGEVVKREFDYGTDKPGVTITCYEPTWRMAQAEPEKAITYRGMISSSIVKLIGSKKDYSGVKGALFDTSQIANLPIFTPRAEVQKAGESDWKFLKRLADVRGWHLFTRYVAKSGKFQLFYGPDTDSQAQVFKYEYNNTLAYPEDNLLSFNPQVNTIDQSSEVEIIAFDEQRKKGVKAKAHFELAGDGLTQSNRKLTGGYNTSKVEKEIKNPQAYRIKAFGTSKKLIVTRPFKDEQELKKFIINYARQTIKNFIVGTAQVIGNEKIQSRQIILFDGLGALFSGTKSQPAKWSVIKAVHRIGPEGYRTEIECRKAVDWIPGDSLTTDLSGAALTAASGALGF